jgi:ferredoxin
MRAVIDKDACISCGLCPSLCPEVFDMEDDGKAGVIVDTVPGDAEPAAQEAASSCPTSAIIIE